MKHAETYRRVALLLREVMPVVRAAEEPPSTVLAVAWREGIKANLFRG
jgi:hypothetical protein